MAVFLTGETRLKNNTAYISSDFINALDLCQTDFAGDVEYLYNGVAITEEEYNSIVGQYFNDSNIASTRQNVGDYLKNE